MSEASNNSNILTRATLQMFDSWLEESRRTGGVVVIDKTQHWTSFDVVAKLRNITKIKKIGHAGTLDPLATGLLIICCGAMTKQISTFQEQTKTYQAVVKLGAKTKTDDAEAEEDDIRSVTHLSEKDIFDVLQEFHGEIQQIPPMFSAIKRNGTPLYKMARKGITLEREPRRVTILALRNVKVELPFMSLEIECSKGTYIRSLARDIGERLGVGGYLASLRRTGIGNFTIDQAISVNDIIEQQSRLTI